MKILIAYASVGAGHFKAAQALRLYIREKFPDIELKFVDVLDEAGPLYRAFYSQSYSFLVEHLQSVWGFIFWATGLEPVRRLILPAVSIFDSLNSRDFVNLLIRENPDIIISTHFLTSSLAASLKAHGRIASRIICVVTDLDVHPFWVYKGVDLYIVATESSRQRLLGSGIRESAIKVCGIPIEPKFILEYDRSSLCEKLGIRKDAFTVLLMTGSFGLGPLERIAKMLAGEVQVLVVSAGNSGLYERLKKKGLSGVFAYGFVDNIHELMAVSDLIITKPGGLTVSEILSMELPPVFIFTVPGQEAQNAAILKKCGIGLSPRSLRELKRRVLYYRDHPQEIEKVRENIRKIKKTDTLGEICSCCMRR
ncbi:MAG: hypothetical protein FJZ09_02875 [Candidatus Omnitrophica bacterium]|nr:hypothetical protein [Candidatus Omnitrophota bacterium]